MSEAGEQDLSFERAESGEKGEGPSSCALCSTPIQGVYYQRGGAVVCAGCRERKLAERERGTPVGTVRPRCGARNGARRSSAPRSGTASAS